MLYDCLRLNSADGPGQVLLKTGNEWRDVVLEVCSAAEE
jgi:hypothetical protein